MKPKTKRLLKEFTNYLNSQTLPYAQTSEGFDALLNDFISQREEKKKQKERQIFEKIQNIFDEIRLVNEAINLHKFPNGCEKPKVTVIAVGNDGIGIPTSAVVTDKTNINSVEWKKAHDIKTKFWKNIHTDRGILKVPKEPEPKEPSPLLYRLKEDCVLMSGDIIVKFHEFDIVELIGSEINNESSFRIIYLFNYAEDLSKFKGMSFKIPNEFVEPIEPKEEPKPCPIDLIREGKMAIENDCKCIILKVTDFCFPKDNDKLFNDLKYYFRWNLDKNQMCCNDETDLPTILATELIKIIEAKEKEQC